MSSPSQSSVFPTILPRRECPLYATPPTHFSLFKPTHLDEPTWHVCWNTPAVVLDGHILHDDSPQRLDSNRSYIRRENEFAGIFYRLYLDPVLTSSWEPFQTGTTLTSLALTMAISNYKYAIDCCQLERDENAYLKIVARSQNQEYLQPDTQRPPFILVVPRALNNVDLHPNLKVNLQLPQAPMVMSITCSADHADTNAYVQEEKAGAKKWFGCAWF